MKIKRPEENYDFVDIASSLKSGDTFMFKHQFLVSGVDSSIYIKTNNRGNCVNLENGINKAIHPEDEVVVVELIVKIDAMTGGYGKSKLTNIKTGNISWDSK